MTNDDIPTETARNGHIRGNKAYSEKIYSIGELAEEFCITTRAIRFYEARGLLRPERIGASRVYSYRDRARLKIILRGKNLGFTLDDIGEYLSLHDTDPTKKAQTEMLLERVEDLTGDLVKKRGDLDRTLQDLHELKEKCHSFLQDLSNQDMSNKES